MMAVLQVLQWKNSGCYLDLYDVSLRDKRREMQESSRSLGFLNGTRLPRTFRRVILAIINDVLEKNSINFTKSEIPVTRLLRQ